MPLSRALTLARSALLPAACVALAAIVTVDAATGDSGLSELRAVRADRVAAERRAAAVAADKAALERRVALLDPARVDPDLADELVRKELRVVRPDEVVIPLPRDPVDLSETD